MGYKIWIVTTFILGTFAPGHMKPTDESALKHSSVSRRIFGGDPAGVVPYMVALTKGSDYFCGGSLVSTRTILTAAHCIVHIIKDGVLNSSVRAIVGTNRWDVSGERYAIARSIIYPTYLATKKNDIGLLITAVEVKLSKNVHTIPLYFGFIGPNVLARATGWGLTEKWEIPSILQQLTVETVDGERCAAEMPKMSRELINRVLFVDPKTELCTFHSKNHGMCKGDSGSPLVLLDSEQQIGIVSWGLPCSIGVPDVFVRISAYKDWLQQNIVG